MHIASKLKDTIRKYIKNKNIMKYARKTYYRLIGDKKGINELNKNYKGKRTLITHFFESSHSQGFNFDEVMEALDNRMLEQFIMIDRMCKIIEKNNKVVKQSEKYS